MFFSIKLRDSRCFASLRNEAEIYFDHNYMIRCIESLSKQHDNNQSRSLHRQHDW
jgi:hypothetical protein